MKVLVTGATGFIGRHVVRILRQQGGFDVIASGRRESELRRLGCHYAVYDLNEDDPDCFRRLGSPDAVIHLAWEPPADYHNLGHVEHTLGRNYRFLKTMLAAGLPILACTGTCFEYGRQEGRLAEDRPSQPLLPYPVAKDALRRFLECLRQEYSFRLAWLRLFFTYGDGQHPRSLIPQLDQAIASGAESFAMSGGEQLRDYLPVDLVAEYIVKAALQPEVEGIINICRGEPITIRGLVERRMRERGRVLQLQLGQIAYRSYEPFAFWGDDRRLRTAVAAYDRQRGTPAARRVLPAPAVWARGSRSA